MTEQEIIEGNKLIAGFIKMKKLSIYFDSYGNQQEEYSMPDNLSIQVYGYTKAQCFLEDQFSKSWDWLIPACLIAIKTGFKKELELIQYGLFHANMYQVFTALIEFIKWHNNQPQ